MTAETFMYWLQILHPKEINTDMEQISGGT
jgi:hypothetical protein